MAFLKAAQGLLSGQPPPSQGTGAPPDMPGLPPPITMTGQMPTGSSANLDAKGAADQATAALREAMGFFPSLAGDISAMIDKLKTAATPPPGPGPSVTAPGAASIAGAPTNPTAMSGSAGAM